MCIPHLMCIMEYQVEYEIFLKNMSMKGFFNKFKCLFNNSLFIFLQQRQEEYNLSDILEIIEGSDSEMSVLSSDDDFDDVEWSVPKESNEIPDEP